MKKLWLAVLLNVLFPGAGLIYLSGSLLLASGGLYLIAAYVVMNRAWTIRFLAEKIEPGISLRVLIEVLDRVIIPIWFIVWIALIILTFELTKLRNQSLQLQKMQGKLYCSKCGKENPPDSIYCQFCGNKMKG